jgi:hypothetical protein
MEHRKLREKTISIRRKRVYNEVQVDGKIYMELRCRNAHPRNHGRAIPLIQRACIEKDLWIEILQNN